MNELARHIEFLLRRHDCVVIPGCGALLCNYEAAHFVSGVEAEADAPAGGCDVSIMAPPARYVAFNELIQDNDGLLAASVVRRERISYESAVGLVATWVVELRKQLAEAGNVRLGRIGRFVLNEAGRLCFEASYLPGINGPLPCHGVLELYSLEAKESASRIREADSRVAVERGEAVAAAAERRRSWRAYATGAVASLAVIVTAVMFLISPIRIDRPAQTASLVPTSAASVQVSEEVTEATQVAYPEVEEACYGAGVVLSLVAPADGVVKAGPGLRANRRNQSAVSIAADGLSATDPFCVIIASFPTRGQAESYVASHHTRPLGILAKDGKFRIYAATGADRASAEAQRASAGEGAWVCRR